MLRPLGNAVIAKKIEVKQQGAVLLSDRRGEETPAQLCEIVALPSDEFLSPLKPANQTYARDCAIYAALQVGMRVYARFRGYMLEEDADGNELFAVAVEDILAIKKEGDA